MKNRVRVWEMAALCVWLSVWLSMTVWAQSGTLVVEELQDRQGQAISDLQVSLYQLGTTGEDGSIKVGTAFTAVLTSEEVLSWQEATAEELREAAEQLKQYIKEHEVTPMEAVHSDATGRVSFSPELAQGIYFVDYTDQTNFSVSPSIVTIPLRTRESSGDVLEAYNIILRAKVEDHTPQETTVEETTPPETSPTETTPAETQPQAETTTQAETTESSSESTEETTESGSSRGRTGGRDRDSGDDGSDDGIVERDPNGSVLGENRNPVEQAVQQVLGAVRDIATGDASMAEIFFLLMVLSMIGLGIWLVCEWRRKRVES